MIALNKIPDYEQRAMTIREISRMEDDLRQQEQKSLLDIALNFPNTAITFGTTSVKQIYNDLSYHEKQRALLESRDSKEPIPYEVLTNAMIMARDNMGESESRLSKPLSLPELNGLVRNTRDILYGRSKFHTL